MDKDFITDKQGVFLISLFMIGSAIILIPGKDAGRYTYIYVILSTILTFPVIYIYTNLLNMYDNKNFYDIVKLSFGKFLGTIICIAYTWFSFHLGSLVLWNFTSFITETALHETPKIIIIIFCISICIWGVKSGLNVLGSFSEFFTPLLILIIAAALIMLIPSINIKNIQPFWGFAKEIIPSSLIGLISFPFTETVVFITVFNYTKNKNSYKKIFSYSILLSGIFGTFITLFIVLVIGESGLKNALFPSYLASQIINIKSFAERLEIIISIIFVIAGFIKVSICLMSCCIGIKSLTGIYDYSIIVVPVGILIGLLSTFIYTSINKSIEWANYTWPYYALPFEILIPLITLIVLKIKKNSNNKAKNI